MTKNNVLSPETLKNDVAGMINVLQHRGPDASGIWVSTEGEIAFGHRRLSIVELSDLGHQPMLSTCGRYVIVFNGEIYNHKEIRKELSQSGKAPIWQGNSDTETMLAAFSTWGLEKSVKKFSGMFAFALWDIKEKNLYLCRDRVGEKPLYYGKIGENFVFASELKAIETLGYFNKRLDYAAIEAYLRYAFIPAPATIYEGIFKLKPGNILKLSSMDMTISFDEFWCLPNSDIENTSARFIDVNTALQELESVLRKSVGSQMEADVPLGAFLSGGIDSSTIVALMQSQSAKKINTFTVGFDLDSYDESQDAKKVAQYLGTNHTEIYLKPSSVRDLVPDIAHYYDEPFADASQLPTYLISKVAKQYVTVCLSGDGGDELFGGYNRYLIAGSFWHKLKFIPQPVRMAISNALLHIRPDTFDYIMHKLGYVMPGKFRQANPGEKLGKIAKLFSALTRDELYSNLLQKTDHVAQLLLKQVNDNDNAHYDLAKADSNTDQIETWMMRRDFLNYLPDDVLVKVDRAAMAVSLETRAPFLDKDVIEFAFQLPLALKIKDGKGKWLLRELLYKYVPREIVDRPKAGFSVPVGHWIKQELREWAEYLLDPKLIKNYGILDSDYVTKIWSKHKAGKHNYADELWLILMLQSWLESKK